MGTGIEMGMDIGIEIGMEIGMGREMEPPYQDSIILSISQNITNNKDFIGDRKKYHTYKNHNIVIVMSSSPGVLRLTLG